MVKFLRRTWNRFSRLGKRRKNKQVWRRPTGRHNKMKDNKRGYPPLVQLGYRGEKKDRGKIQMKEPITVNNMRDLEKVKKDEIIILGHMGKKKKIELCKKVQEKGLNVYNVNVKKFLKNSIKVVSGKQNPRESPKK